MSTSTQPHLEAMFNAWHQLRQLGWNEMLGYPRDGTVVEVITAGSTGIHDAYFGHGTWWVMSQGDLWPAHPLLWRPKLTPAARLETITDGDRIHRSAKQLIDQADSLGKVVTIERTPLYPLAMGHAEYLVSVREKRVRS